MTEDLRQKFVTLHEFVEAAREQLSSQAWGYLIGGTETETTVKRNRAALDAIALRPRVLRDVSVIDSHASILGQRLRLPVLLAPVGGLESFDPRGALAVAEAANDFGLAMMVSSTSVQDLNALRQATKAPLIFQLYVRGDGDWLMGEVQRTLDAGVDGFCLTVDTAVYSRRERDLVQRFEKPWRVGVNKEAARYQAALSWSAVEAIKARFDLPLMIKGIATGEDARLAAEVGVDVVYLSNHGGRQLDHGRGALDLLPEILEAVDKRAQVYIDGGFCRGSDIVKAMALGADAIGLGRLYCYGLAAAGAPGLLRLLEILEDEVRSAMGLLGATSFAALGPTHTHGPVPPVVLPDVFSAFPLLDRSKLEN